jgi:hypothetical protein
MLVALFIPFAPSGLSYCRYDVFTLVHPFFGLEETDKPPLGLGLSLLDVIAILLT